MIKYYKLSEGKLVEGDSNTLQDPNLVWIDMVSPTKDEENLIESFFKIDVPTREETHDIEVSSRLYSEDGALFVTGTLMTGIETDTPETNSITFILKDKVLITVRYSESKAFGVFVLRASRKQHTKISHNIDILLGIMEAVIDCVSDGLKFIGIRLDEISKSIFKKDPKYKDVSTHNLQNILEHIGHYGDLNAKLSESLISISQMFIYLANSEIKYERSYKKTMEQYSKDISSLIDHTDYIGDRVNLLLNASLGMINIRQNNIIKIFSVAAVVFLPPTLIASIYGMNFKHMPELEWIAGYPLAISLMLISAILPYYYFKKKKWL